MSLFDDPDTYRTILENLQVGICLIDREQKILFWNDGAERIAGYLRQNVVGSLHRADILATEDEESQASPVAAAISAVLRDGKLTSVEASVRHKDGHRIPVRLRAFPIRNRQGAIIGAAESFDEAVTVSEWERRQSKLERYGCLDRTSGVLNQGFIETQLRECIETFTAHLLPFSVVCAQVDNLDRFKATYGSGVAAAILRGVAQTLEASLRPTDFVGRYSESEFVAILTECTGAEVDSVARRLKKMVAFSKIKWWGDELSVSASFGAATVRSNDTVQSILDRALKSANQSMMAGGNCVTVAS